MLLKLSTHAEQVIGDLGILIFSMTLQAKLLEGGTEAEQVIGRLSASLSSQTRQRSAKRKRPESSDGLPPAKVAASERNAIQVGAGLCLSEQGGYGQRPAPFQMG